MITFTGLTLIIVIVLLVTAVGFTLVISYHLGKLSASPLSSVNGRHRRQRN